MHEDLPNLNNKAQSYAFVSSFRDALPYIHAHRERTFVIFFGGEALLDDTFAHLIHDIALLNSLGIKLVLIHGIRPQIDERLQRVNIVSQFVNNLRITDAIALNSVKEAAGIVRVEIEALFSMGVVNSPMSGACVNVASGNFVIAKPIGVIDGIDYCHTGTVRRIDIDAINEKLNQNNIVLISPIGYSSTGDVFNLSAEQLATEVAIALRAEKLFFLVEQTCTDTASGRLIPQLTTVEAASLIQETPNKISDDLTATVQAAIKGSQAGVERIHLMSRQVDGGLLLELLTRDGVGTLISATPYEVFRKATLSDVAGILELIVPLEQQGVLKKRTRESLEIEISNYLLIERDGLVIACASLQPVNNTDYGIIACLAVNPNYQNENRGRKLLRQIIISAEQIGLKKLFLLSTQTAYWFIEQGFQQVLTNDLPEEMRHYYDDQRNSKVLYCMVEGTHGKAET